MKGPAGLCCDREGDVTAPRSPLTLRGCCNWRRCCVRKSGSACVGTRWASYRAAGQEKPGLSFHTLRITVRTNRAGLKPEAEEQLSHTQLLSEAGRAQLRPQSAHFNPTLSETTNRHRFNNDSPGSRGFISYLFWPK